MTVDFSDVVAARESIRSALVERLSEQNHVLDARVQLTIATLNQGEVQILKQVADIAPGATFYQQGGGGFNVGGIDVFQTMYISRLMDKQVIAVAGAQPDGRPAYRLTPLGHVVAKTVKATFP